MDRLLQEASALTLLVGQFDLTDPSNVQALIAQLVRQGLLVDWAYAGAYRAWREAAIQDHELRALNQQIERWTASFLERLFQGLLQLSGARQEIDVTTLAWELSLLFLRLAEVPLQTPSEIETVVASLTALILHGLFMDQELRQ